MPLTTASIFLAGALLSCLLPISLLICFASFFMRQARRLPPNATPVGGQVREETPAAPESTGGERQFPNVPG